MRGKQVERAFQALGKRLAVNVAKAVRDTAREGLAIARQDSSGRWNRRRRRKAGYSYSRFDPKPPPQPLGVINIETGVFLAAWRVEPVRSAISGDVTAYIINDSDRVRDLVDASGKPWLSRPIDRRVADRVTPIFRFNVERAVARTLRG